MKEANPVCAWRTTHIGDHGVIDGLRHIEVLQCWKKSFEKKNKKHDKQRVNTYIISNWNRNRLGLLPIIFNRFQRRIMTSVILATKLAYLWV